MIKYLQRLKGKKGFTIVELVVVVAIIAVLITIMSAALLGGNTEKILSANASAEAFFPACQLAFTRAQLTERELVTYEPTDIKFIEYKEGKNQIADGKFLFVEAKFEQSGIVGLHINYTLNELMARDDFTAAMTALERYLATNINEYLADSYDGYFYAQVDNNFKVVFTHFCDGRLPVWNGTDDYDTFRDSMMVDSQGKITGNKLIIGSCSDVYTVPETGQYAFDLPESTSDYSKYFKL
ncbi:MAG: prepilin-type N-terminal cleavage/methylation domain-containing protein [Oscillospiraceae bacterium]